MHRFILVLSLLWFLTYMSWCFSDENSADCWLLRRRASNRDQIWERYHFWAPDWIFGRINHCVISWTPFVFRSGLFSARKLILLLRCFTLVSPYRVLGSLWCSLLRFLLSLPKWKLILGWHHCILLDSWRGSSWELVLLLLLISIASWELFHYV